jgi:hypothetical protein
LGWIKSVGNYTPVGAATPVGTAGQTGISASEKYSSLLEMPRNLRGIFGFLRSVSPPPTKNINALAEDTAANESICLSEKKYLLQKAFTLLHSPATNGYPYLNF